MATTPSRAEDVGPGGRTEAQGGVPLGVRGLEAASAVRCVLAQRLTGDEAEAVVAALPIGLRPLMEGCVRYPLDRDEAFDRAEFLRRVAARLHVTAPEAAGPQ